MSYQPNEYPEQSYSSGRHTHSIDNNPDAAPPQLTETSYSFTPPHIFNHTDGRDSYQSQTVPDISTDAKRNHNHSQGSYTTSQDYARNQRTHQLDERYKPESQKVSASDQSVMQPKPGSVSYRDGLPTYGKDATHRDDDYDTNSVVSSSYSQPSAVGDATKHHFPLQEHNFSSEKNDSTRDQAVPNEEDSYVFNDHVGHESTGQYDQTESYKNHLQHRSIPDIDSGYNTYDASHEGHDTHRHAHNMNNEQNYLSKENDYYTNNTYVTHSGDGEPYYGQFDVYNDFNNVHRPQDSYNYEGSGRVDSSRHSTDESNMQSRDRAIGNFGSDEKPRGPIVATQKDTKKSKKKRCCYRQACVLITFIILLILAVVLFFVWPRKPEVQITGASRDDNANATISLTPPLVKMSLNLQIQLRNQGNWIPIRFKKVDMKVFDSSTMDTNRDPVATGQLTDYTLPPRTDTDLPFPLTIDYVGKDANDPTLQDFIGACTKSDKPDKPVPSTLNIRADVQFFIWGISWIYKPTVTAGLADLQCPYQIGLSNAD